MVTHNPNNWHWVEKNCLPWSKDYFQKNIIGTSGESEGLTVAITSVDSVEGDCDVTQRKGKVLCIYDMSLKFSVSGEKDGSPVTGSILVPEFIHDQEEDEYLFNIESEYHSEIKSLIIPVLKSELMKFQSNLIMAHEKDIQHNT